MLLLLLIFVLLLFVVGMVALTAEMPLLLKSTIMMEWRMAGGIRDTLGCSARTCLL